MHAKILGVSEMIEDSGNAEVTENLIDWCMVTTDEGVVVVTKAGTDNGNRTVVTCNCLITKTKSSTIHSLVAVISNELGYRTVTILAVAVTAVGVQASRNAVQRIPQLRYKKCGIYCP